MRGVQNGVFEVNMLLWNSMTYLPDDDHHSDASCDSSEDYAKDDAGNAHVERSSPWLCPGNRRHSPWYSAAVSTAVGAGAVRDVPV